VLKQLVAHGRNLGLFVLIYKLICSFLRYYGMRTGLESWIAGFVGGYYGFGDSSGVRGAVNKQVVLYLFARGLHGGYLSGGAPLLRLLWLMFQLCDVVWLFRTAGIDCVRCVCIYLYDGLSTYDDCV
jgi:Tim17/Tim22/Tim23/Pmp24 family